MTEAMMSAKTTLEAGQLTADGIYIGRFKDRDGTEKDWFADVDDAKDDKGNRLALTFNQASGYARKSDSLGHHDWIVPPGCDDRGGAPDILEAMFNGKAKIGGFDEASDPYKEQSNWYWSSSPHFDHTAYAWYLNLAEGNQYSGKKTETLSVRLVRSVPVI